MINPGQLLKTLEIELLVVFSGVSNFCCSVKEYEQNHNTIEPAPLGIEPNMICIETQQTTHNQQASGPRTGTFREVILGVSNQYCRAQGT